MLESYYYDYYFVSLLIVVYYVHFSHLHVHKMLCFFLLCI